MFTPRFLRARALACRALLAGLVALTFVVASAEARAEGVRIHVRGTGRISARAAREPRDPSTAEGDLREQLILSGALSDDAGRALVAQSITIRVTRDADVNDAKVAAALREARGCDKRADRAPLGAPAHGPMAWSVRVAGPTDAPEVIVVTDEDGRFCFRAKLDPDRYKAHLVWRDPRANGMVDGTERELAFDLTRRSLLLGFDPKPHVVRLDGAAASFEAVAIIDDEATPKVAPSLSLALTAEDGRELGRAVTDASGRARFNVESGKLGPPGLGELSVSFAGNAETANASTSEDIERRVKVTLRVPAAERGELKPQNPDDGIPLIVDVGSAVGPVTEGSVEARVGDVVVGAAPVERGIARITVTFTAQGSEALVRLRYVPASPWYEPLAEPAIPIPIRGPGILAKAPILVAGFAVLLFFLIGRVSSKGAKPAPGQEKRDDEDVPDGKARAVVVRAAKRGDEGWTGRVIDAHEATPLAGAQVWIERGTFEGRTVLASATTGESGLFELPSIGVAHGDELLGAEAPLHARLVQSLPASGEIAIALAERRRALLGRLVHWAKGRGAPFDLKPEPTPGHVRRAAADDVRTARWADAVERAVYGGARVDARLEREVDQMEPGSAGSQGDRAEKPEREDGGADRR